MRALWLTAVAVAALASVATARGSAGEQSFPASPGRRDTTATARGSAAPSGANPVVPARCRAGHPAARADASRARAQSPGHDGPGNPSGNPPGSNPPGNPQASRRATARASSVRRSSRPLPLYAQARSVERAAAVREVIVSPAGPPRTSLSAGFNEYITRMNIWTRPPWEIPATVGATVPARDPGLRRAGRNRRDRSGVCRRPVRGGRR